MGLQDDPRVQRLLQKATIENLLKLYFKSIYGDDEIQRMENTMKSILQKYDKKEKLFEKLLQNEENEAKPFLEECLHAFCEKTLNRPKGHTPESLVMLSKFFIKLGYFRLACEMLWGCASLTIQKFINDHKLNIELNSHNSKRRFARALSADIGRRFLVFEICHNSFYTDEHNAGDINNALKEANEFIEQLGALEISDEKKAELEKKDFY